jgi:hypothetical protein
LIGGNLPVLFAITTLAISLEYRGAIAQCNTNAFLSQGKTIGLWDPTFKRRVI